MSNSALSKLMDAFKTPQHDYKVNTEIFGQFDPDKVAKELKLEKVGAEKGKLNQPASKSQIPDEMLKDLTFVLVSIDPETDTPERLKAFAIENQMDDEQWTFLCALE